MGVFVNTVNKIGEDAFVDSILAHTFTELYDDRITQLGDRALYYNLSLTTVNLPNALTIGHQAFYYCSALVNVSLPKVTTVESSAFTYCKKLVTIDLPSVTMINSPFSDCDALRHIILRSNTMCAVSSLTFSQYSPIGNGIGYVYVPSALFDTYKADTNWSKVSSRLRKLEDYTVDGTVTGALDTSKI